MWEWNCIICISCHCVSNIIPYVGMELTIVFKCSFSLLYYHLCGNGIRFLHQLNASYSILSLMWEWNQISASTECQLFNIIPYVGMKFSVNPVLLKAPDIIPYVGMESLVCLTIAIW